MNHPHSILKPGGWSFAVLVVICTLAAWLNSLDGDFLMDDFPEILDNPSMESPWQPLRAMFVGNELIARPLPYLTFLIDRTIWGKHPFGFHVTNVAIHIVATLALFSLVRTALLSPRIQPEFIGCADLVALIIAAAWATHPLQTQAVTYIYQRMESLAGMLCLVSMAAFARAAAQHWDVRWLWCSVVASAAAMLSKENAVVLPLLIASYDWLIIGGRSPGSERRKWFYVALFSTWLVLGFQMALQGARYETSGFKSATPLAYALTQPRVILHYLRLVVWPRKLCFDYLWPISETWGEIVPSFLYLVVLIAAVLWGLVRRNVWAWLGIVFLLALAPSSSVLPLGAVAEEYRMYLPLAPAVSAIVLAVYSAIRIWATPESTRKLLMRGAVGLAFVWLVVLISLTQARNRVYATPGGVWLDTLEQGKIGTRALWNLAVVCDYHGAFPAAIGYADRVLEINPKHEVYEHLVQRRVRSSDLKNAELYLRHTISTRAALIAKADASALMSVCMLVNLLNNQQRCEEAEALAGEHLANVRAGLGDDHPETISLMVIRAYGLLRTGNADAAEHLARMASAASRRAGKEDVQAAECLAEVLRVQGRDNERAASGK